VPRALGSLKVGSYPKIHRPEPSMKTLLSILALLVVSCSSPKIVSGNYFDDQWVDSIVAGETTMAEIRNWFGEPILSELSKKGQLVVTYEYRLGPVHPKNSISESSGDPKLAGKLLVVGFSDEIVTYHSFSENEAGYVGTLVFADR
jgi:hypothetical protein